MHSRPNTQIGTKKMNDPSKQEAPVPIAQTFVDVELEDGTVARWFIPESRVNDIVDCLTTRLGEPETIRL
jgi:hypothetical protein